MSEKQLDCPSCGKERHLYFNIEKQVFYCFRCGYSGKGSELAVQGIPIPKKTSELLKPPTQSYRLGDSLSDPPEYYPLTTSSREYLTSRGVHGSIMNTLRKKIYETPKGILFFYPDEDYWQIRHWSAWSPPRWVNPTTAPRTPAGGVVFHLRTYYDSDRVVLVEGIVDALRVAPFANVAAVLSSNVHERQIEQLGWQGYERADIMLDGDVPLSKLFSQQRKVAGYFPSARILACPASDPGSAKDADIERILHA